MYLRDLVKNGKCEVNGKLENRGYLLKTNDFIEIEIDAFRRTSMKPENIPLEIIFEDAHLLVINKPSGMLAHPSHRENSGTVLNALAFYLNSGFGGRNGEYVQGNTSGSATNSTHHAFIRPGLVHRLDKQTSGLMVVARTPRSHRILCRHFEKKLVEKRYLALVEGTVEKNEGIIDAPIGRYPDVKYWDIKSGGKAAVTRFLVRERFPDSTLLELEPVTGRTNQLRIHCTYLGHPIVGDVARGARAFARLCLHAYKLGFWHPDGTGHLEFQVEAPLEMMLDSLAWGVRVPLRKEILSLRAVSQ